MSFKSNFTNNYFLQTTSYDLEKSLNSKIDQIIIINAYSPCSSNISINSYWYFSGIGKRHCTRPTKIYDILVTTSHVQQCVYDLYRVPLPTRIVVLIKFPILDLIFMYVNVFIKTGTIIIYARSFFHYSVVAVVVIQYY